jgi:hypothetical protein
MIEKPIRYPGSALCQKGMIELSGRLLHQLTTYSWRHALRRPVLCGMYLCFYHNSDVTDNHDALERMYQIQSLSDTQLLKVEFGPAEYTQEDVDAFFTVGHHLGVSRVRQLGRPRSTRVTRQQGWSTRVTEKNIQLIEEAKDALSEDQ